MAGKKLQNDTRTASPVAEEAEEVSDDWRNAVDLLGDETQEIPPELLDEDDDPLTAEVDLRKLLSDDENNPQQNKESHKMVANGPQSPTPSLMDMIDKWAKRGKEIEQEISALRGRINELLSEKDKHSEIGRMAMKKFEEAMKGGSK